MLAFSAHGQPAQLQQLLQRADELQLDQDAAWQNLLHYKSHVFGGVYSQADDARFFLAPAGKQDARAELIATLKTFVEDDQGNSARCRFPARLHWLDSQLNFADQLPAFQCTEFEIWKQKLNASQVTLVFPAMYLNNPASMFGHTFIRLDQTGKSNLLSYTLSYGAQSDPEDNALQYVVNGLAGGYKGVFSVQPYYETVEKYGDIEHRDIWEYALNLNADEMAQLIRHAWEVKNIHFDYYFLRENCSYRLLSLLDVARPGINITHNNHPVYALPVDTVRTVAAAGLIDAVHYRPAITSRLEQMYQQVSDAGQKTTLEIIQSRDDNWHSLLESFDAVEQARILELANDWQQFIAKNDTQKSHELLLERSRLDVAENDVEFLFEADNPIHSHASARASFVYGEHERQHFVELAFRPVFHDLMDQVTGFATGAAISVLDTHVRWYEDEQRLRLQQLKLFELKSLVPVQPWSNPVSAKLSVSIDRRLLTDTQDSKFFNLDMGLGYSVQFESVIFYALVDMDIDYSKKLDESYALYFGGEAGALFTYGKSRMQFLVQPADSISGHEGRKEQYSWQYQYMFATNHALKMQYQTVKQFIRDSSSSIGYMYYF